MKMIKETSFSETRRLILFSMLALPLLPYTYTRAEKRSLFVPAILDAEDFVIMNGWVMRKQDITE
jgi:hypothetical protein